MVKQLFDSHPLNNIYFEAVLEEIATLFAYIWWEGRRSITRLDHLHDLRGVLAVLDPGRLPRQHLNDAAAQTPHVGGFAGAFAPDHFRGHPVWAAFDFTVWRGQHHAARAAPLTTTLHVLRVAHHRDTHRLELGRGAEVGQFHDALRVDEDVRALQVPVQDVLLVQILETVHDLDCVDAHQCLIKLAEPVENLSD